MRKKIVRAFLVVFLAGIIIVFGSLRKVVISGSSMEPTLHEGNAYFVDRLYYHLRPIRRGDVALVIHQGEDLVKRVYALEGDRVQFIYDPFSRMMHILNNPIARRLARVYGFQAMKVPEGHIFLLGDNPAVSEDSRMYGPIPRNEVIGLIRRMNLTRDFPLPEGLDAYKPPAK
ncbi:MAG: signal peptidase I [Armatimonadetes bacterium]|nr:signal peptidase I [Armatimonadota bacterium]